MVGVHATAPSRVASGAPRLSGSGPGQLQTEDENRPDTLQPYYRTYNSRYIT